MKPHIVFRRGVWCCGVLSPSRLLYGPYGHGYTPSQALIEWQSNFVLNSKAA